MTDDPAGTRLQTVDGLRGIAISMVLFWHYVMSTVPPALRETWPWRALIDLGWLSWSGVDLFFVISGFLIGSILLRNQGSSNLLQIFFLRRALRILPLYVLGLVLFFLALAMGLGQLPSGQWLFNQPLPAWSYLTFTQNIVMASEQRFGANWLAMTWSLAVEEQFYALAAIGFWILGRRSMLVACLVAIPLAALFRALFVHSLDNWYAGHALLPARMDLFAAGILVAALPEVRAWAKNRAAALASVALGLLAALTASSILRGTWVLFGGYGLLVAIYACLLLAALQPGPLAAVLALRPLRWLGLRCYGIYLFHQPVNGLLHLWRPAGIPVVPSLRSFAFQGLCAATTFALAELLWRLIERPAITLGHRYRYRGVSPAVAPAQSPIGA